jgi:hypothetical protein
MRRRTFLALPLVCGFVAAGPLRAQTVAGAVVEEGTGRPLVGAFVQLEDSAGDRHGGILSGPAGEFVIRAPASGRYRIIAELIGYADPGTVFVMLAEGETVRLTLEVPVRAVSLGAITAQVGERCRPRPGAGTATARLWDEARKALQVARWAETQNVLRFHLIEHVRELEGSTLEVLSNRESGWTGFYDRSPYASRISAEALARGGYVRPAADGTWDFHAPDARVLLSESFLDTHCFRVVPAPTDEPGLVGLGFEPVPGRSVSDIRGTLWVDEGSAELRRIDYTYATLPFAHGDWPEVGGRLVLERLATGIWIVRRWHIRMPVEATQDRDGVLTLDRLQEQGAEVRDVWTRGGTRLAEATGSTVFGIATGPDGAPLAGARVEIPEVGVRTVTGEDGGYRLSDLPEGTWAVQLHHPLLVMVGAPPEEATVETRAGRAARLLFRVALNQDRARALCLAAGWDPERGPPVLLYGLVRSLDGGRPIPAGLVRMSVGGGERRVVADSSGVYRTCLTPSREPVYLTASVRGHTGMDVAPLEAEPTPVDVPGFTRVDLLAAAQPVGGRTHADTAAALVGRVLDDATDGPVAEATVVLRDTTGRAVASQVTDDDGRFRIPHPGRGSRFTLSVEHVAFATSEGGVLFPPVEHVLVEVQLARQAIELDPVIVRERRGRALLDAGYYDRKARGAGVFVDRREIERRSPTRITDMLRGRAGLRVVNVGLGATDVRFLQQVNFQYSPDRCQPAVWIDGGLAREGGTLPARGDRGAMALSSLMSPEHVEAMEVYDGTAGLPSEYAEANAPCGIILIWTRRPDPPV